MALAGQAGLRAVQDRVEDLETCTCVRVFLYAPSVHMYAELIQARNIPVEMQYTFAPCLPSDKLIKYNFPEVARSTVPVSYRLMSSYVIELDDSRGMLPCPVVVLSRNDAWKVQTRRWQAFIRECPQHHGRTQSSVLSGLLRLWLCAVEPVLHVCHLVAFNSSCSKESSEAPAISGADRYSSSDVQRLASRQFATVQRFL